MAAALGADRAPWAITGAVDGVGVACGVCLIKLSSD
jgi:hypothetical protein